MTVDAVRELAPHLAARRRRAPARAPQPLHDRPRAARVRGGREGRLSGRCTPRGGRCRAGPRSPRRRAPSATSRRRATRHRARPRGARRRVRALRGARPRQGPAARRAARVRRRLLPPPASGRDGHHHAADARGAAPPRAVRRRARGGHARPRRDGLPDPRHARLAVRGQPGSAQRDRLASAGRTSRTRRSATSSATTASRAAPVDPEIADRVLSLPQAAKLRDLQPISLEGARERFGARISEEELLLRLTMPEEQVDAMVARAAGNAGARALARGPAAARWSRCCASSPARGDLRLRARRRATTRWCGAVPADVRLGDVRGFVFDVDGTLAHRGPDGRARPQPGGGRGARADPGVGPAAGAVHERQPRPLGDDRPRAARGRAAGRRRRDADAGRERDQLPPPPPPRPPALLFASDVVASASRRPGIPVDRQARRPRWCSSPTSTRPTLAMERAARAVDARARRS